MKKTLSLASILALSLFSLATFAGAATLSTPLTVGTSYPALGATTTVSGSCGSPGANSSVSFKLMQNGSNTALPGSVNTDATGAFSGSATFPTSFPSGPATLVATCGASGDVINSSTITFPAPTGTSFNLPSGSPIASGTFNLSGACGPSNGAGTAQLSFFNNGSTTSFGTVNLTSTGTFSSIVVIPSTASAGSGTLTANCSNGTTFTSAVTVGPAIVNSFSMGANPTLGATSPVSGTCIAPTVGSSANNNGNITFALVRNGVTTPLSAVNTTTSSSGAFNSSVSLPSGFGSGAATLVVTCPNGSTFNSQANLLDPATLPSGGGLAFPGGAAAGTSVAATPVGGVNAGSPVKGPSDEMFLIAGLLGALAAGLFVLSRYADARK